VLPESSKAKFTAEPTWDIRPCCGGVLFRSVNNLGLHYVLVGWSIYICNLVTDLPVLLLNVKVVHLKTSTAASLAKRNLWLF
jgi:hypothetical protein